MPQARLNDSDSGVGRLRGPLRFARKIYKRHLLPLVSPIQGDKHNLLWHHTICLLLRPSLRTARRRQRELLTVSNASSVRSLVVPGGCT